MIGTAGTMTRFGKCSISDEVHPAPFGSCCMYLADAKQYCIDHEIDEAEFKNHIDYAGMPKPTKDDEVDREDGAASGVLSAKIY